MWFPPLSLLLVCQLCLYHRKKNWYATLVYPAKKISFAGTIGVVDISRFASYGYDQRLEVFGPGGMLQVDNDKPNSSIHYNNTGISKYIHFILLHFLAIIKIS